MRPFLVQRHEDVTGISGEGVVAEGVMFDDGWVVVHWLDRPPMNEPKTEVWHNKGVMPFEKVSGHNGKTEVVWLDYWGGRASEGDIALLDTILEHLPEMRMDDDLRSTTYHRVEDLKRRFRLE